MSKELKAFQQAVMARSILNRYASEGETIAKEFPSQEALQEYLKKHPNADKSKHTVNKDDDDTKKLKENLKNWQGIQKGQEKSKADKEKRDEKKDTDKLKKNLEKFKQDFPEGSIKSGE